MRISILKENLVKALNIVGRSISIRPQLPILSCVLIDGRENLLKISATNLELGSEFSASAKIEKTGEVVVPGKLLSEFVTSLPNEKLLLYTEDKNLIVEASKTKASFATVTSSDFPSFPAVPSEKRILTLAKIKDIIPRAIFAASNDEGRPVLTGVKMEIKDGKLNLSATDGYRLSIEQIDLGGKVDDLLVILPAASLVEILRVALEVEANEVGFSVIENKNQVVFTLPNTLIYTRIIDGEFPNVAKIVPAGFKTRVVIDRDMFTQAVKIASLFARGAANIVKIKIEKEGLRLSANTPQVGSDETFVEANVTGEEMSVAFNFRFLLDVLNNFPDKEVVFELTGSINPGVFKPATAKLSYLHIIMPVRLQG